MLSIFSDLLEDCMEVFMDDFTVCADTFNACLGNLPRVLKQCIEIDLVLNFEKCHFMVTKGIVLGHLVSSRGIKVDKAKIHIITSLPNLASVREVRSFLGHACFYRHFITNFSKTALPLSKLLQKDVEFVFNKECIQAFEELKTRLTSMPILQAPNWELPFKLMCDASNSALRAILGQRDGVGQPTHEFDLEIKDKKDADNVVADHLSRIEHELDPMSIRDDFLNEQLLRMDTSTPWFADICNFIVASQFPPEASQFPPEASRLYREKIKSDSKYYMWDDPTVVTKSFVGAFWTPRSAQSSIFVMQQSEAAIMDKLKQPRRYSTVGFIGPPFFEMPTNSSWLANNAKE
ncbi:Retrovirus-related Pol polyprotein from transposon opus, partial [Mucuna pruriens]